jgi:H+/Cl- antiporter ClcA
VEMSFSQKLKDDLRTVAIWARLAAIFSFVTTACIFVQNVSKGFITVIVVLILAAIFVIMGIYLFNFGNKTKKGIETIDQNELEEGMDNLRRYFKISVRVLIGALALVLLIIIFSLFSSSSGVPGMY